MIPKWFQNGIKSDPKATPESNQNKCCQNASKVFQKDAQNDQKKHSLKLEKDVSRDVFPHQTTTEFPEAVFLVFEPLQDGPNPENHSKTLHYRSKSKVPPFPEKPELFIKRRKNNPQGKPERHQKATKTASGEPLETHSKKNTKKTKKINPPAFGPEHSGAPPPPNPLPIWAPH